MFYVYTAFLCVGITNFDLIGNYGKITWLRSYVIIFFVNFTFGKV